MERAKKSVETGEIDKKVDYLDLALMCKKRTNDCCEYNDFDFKKYCAETEP